jgi:hypothetical protein
MDVWRWGKTVRLWWCRNERDVDGVGWNGKMGGSWNGKTNLTALMCFVCSRQLVCIPNFLSFGREDCVRRWYRDSHTVFDDLTLSNPMCWFDSSCCAHHHVIGTWVDRAPPVLLETGFSWVVGLEELGRDCCTDPT